MCFAGDGPTIERAVDKIGYWLARQPRLGIDTPSTVR
jgi:hypothetical protein